MKKTLRGVLTYLATNKKARAAEWGFICALVEAIRASTGHA